MNLWTNNKKNKKLNFKFSNETIKKLDNNQFKIRKGKEEKEYNKKVSQKTWNKRLP